MTNIKLLLVTALAILAAATAGQTLSSEPEWHSLSAKGTDVAMEELTLSYELREGALTGDVDVTFKSDYFPLNQLVARADPGSKEEPDWRRELGARVGNESGLVVTAIVTARDVLAVASEASVDYVELSRPLLPDCG